MVESCDTNRVHMQTDAWDNTRHDFHTNTASESGGSDVTSQSPLGTSDIIFMTTGGLATKIYVGT